MTALIVGVAITAAACGSDSSPTSEPGTEPPATSAVAAETTADTGAAADTDASGSTGGLVGDLNTIANAFTTCVEQRFTQPLNEAGIDVFSLYNDFTPEKQQANVETAITRKANAVLHTAFNPAVDATTIKTLQEAGIKVVLLLGAAPEGTSPEAVLDGDNVGAAKTAAEKLIATIPGLKEVGIIGGVPGTPSSDASEKSLTETFEAGGVKVVANIPGEFTSTGGATAAQDLLQGNPNLQAIVALGDDAALAAARTVKSAGSDVPVVGIYSFSKAALDAVKNGDLLFVMYQPTTEWGMMIADATESVLSGETVQPQVLRLEPVDQSNVADIKDAC